MRNFLPARRITPDERSLIPGAIWQLLLARLQVSFTPSRVWMNRINRQNVRAVVAEEIFSCRDFCRTLAGVINGLSRRTPWRSTCLVKALAAHRMLARRGIKSTVHLGVKKSDSKGLEAHAWLSVDGSVRIGGENMNEYSEVTSI